VHVREEEKRFGTRRHGILHRHPIADRAQIIAEVEIAGRLDAGDDTHA